MQREDHAAALVVLHAALGAQLAHGQVLGDALLDVLEARVVSVEHLARMHGIEPLLGASAPGHGDQPVEVGADHRRLARLLAHPLEPAKLLLGLLAHGVGHAGGLDLRAVLLDDGGVVLAELLADRVHLSAQEPLALLSVGAGLDVVADALAHLQLGEPLALQPHRELEPLSHVERLEQLDLLLEREVGGVARRVGERAGLADRAHERLDAPVVAAQLEQLLDDRAVLALELARAAVDRLIVGVVLDLDVQLAVGCGVGGAGDAAVEAAQHDGAPAAGQAHAVAHVGDGADARERALVTRHEQDALLVADVHGQRQVHRREDDDVLEGDQQQSAHEWVRFLSGSSRKSGRRSAPALR